MTPRNLAQLRHAADERELRRRFLADEVFTGDSDAEAAMREASNGFEHGYMQLRDVQGLLEPVLERSMGHVRRTLVEALGLAPEARRRLLAATYDEPRGLVPPIWVVGGELSREDPAQEVPPMDGAPIELAWKGAPLFRQFSTPSPPGRPIRTRALPQAGVPGDRRAETWMSGGHSSSALAVDSTVTLVSCTGDNW
jgi:hypothetical protein